MGIGVPSSTILSVLTPAAMLFMTLKQAQTAQDKSRPMGKLHHICIPNTPAYRDLDHGPFHIFCTSFHQFSTILEFFYDKRYHEFSINDSRNQLKPVMHLLPHWMKKYTTETTYSGDCQYTCLSTGGCIVQYRGYTLGKCEPN